MRWLCHPGGTKRDWTNGDLVPSYEEALGILELLTLILLRYIGFRLVLEPLDESLLCIL